MPYRWAKEFGDQAVNLLGFDLSLVFFDNRRDPDLEPAGGQDPGHFMALGVSEHS
jgi:hypothetical protein